MTNLMLLYDNAADEGSLSGGSWSLPLTNLQDPRPTKMAQSSDVSSASTTFRIQLTAARTFRAIVFGPTNYSSGGSYRIRGYSDSGYTSLVDDTGVIILGSEPAHTLDMHWTDAYWWSGAQPLDDPGNAAGIWVIHVYDSDITAQYWDFSLDNQSNPDGFLKIGRLFMGTAWIPSLNYTPESNKFSFASLTASQSSAGGSRYYHRRRAARAFSWSHPFLPKTEVTDDVYRIAAIAGTDRQVFVIPDPDDIDRRTTRSFLGTLDELPSWAFNNVDGGGASTGFQVTEVI